MTKEILRLHKLISLKDVIRNVLNTSLFDHYEAGQAYHESIAHYIRTSATVALEILDNIIKNEKGGAK